MVEFFDNNTQHANDLGRGHVDLVFQTRTPPAGFSFVHYECSMQINPFPNGGSVPLLCENEPVVLPAPVWESCAKGRCSEGPCHELIVDSNINNRRTWRLHSPIEGRYTFEVRAVFNSGSEISYVNSVPRTMFLDMKTNPPQIIGPKHRRVSNCSNVRIPVKTESQPRVWYTRNGEFTSLEGEHALGEPCFPHKVQFHVPLLLSEFHEDGFEPVEQPGWNVAPGQTIYEKIRLEDIWLHPAAPDVEFSINCDLSSRPIVRFLKPPPPNSPLPLAIFEFESDIVDATFQCSLDDAAFARCTSPHRVALPTNKSYTFRVRALNAESLRGEEQTHTWERIPQAEIPALPGFFIDNPRNIGVQHSSLVAMDGRALPGTQLLVLASTTRGSNEELVAQCQLTVDASGWWRCPISKILYDGTYRAEVYAWDADNDWSRSEIYFTVHEETPYGSIRGNQRPPLFSEISANSLAFQVDWPWVALADTPQALECRVDGEEYTSCTSTECCTTTPPCTGDTACLGRYTAQAPFAPGLHRFQVRLTDATIRADELNNPTGPRYLQNATPLEYTWFVGGDAQFRPDISLPSKAGEWLGGSTLLLRGKAEPFLPLSIYLNDRPVCERVEVTHEGHWECEVWDATEGEYEVTARIYVLPKDSHGHYWMSRKFGFLRGNPQTFIIKRPFKYEQSHEATFEFASPRKQIARFECKVDQKAFATCKSPLKLSNLSEGPHTFQVRAIDLAGQTETEPATWNWSIGDMPPSSGCATTALPPAWLGGLLALGLWAQHQRKQKKK